jgi:putative transposase
VLKIAPSLWYDHLARQRNPGRASARSRRDADLKTAIRRVWEANSCVYGLRKLWRALKREGISVARCTVERLMKEMKIQGALRGKKVITTNPDASSASPDDKVKRNFKADRPNQLWVSDFTYVSTWQGMIYVAFVIDVFARKIVGWKVSSSMKTQFVLDALEQAIHQRRPEGAGLVHHSDRGSQYLSIHYAKRLAEAGIDPSVGTVGDSYDNALAETVIGLFKTEVVKRRSSWKSLAELEWATLNWVDWFNNRRLLAPIGYITPTEAEENFYETLKKSPIPA